MNYYNLIISFFSFLFLLLCFFLMDHFVDFCSSKGSKASC